MTKIIPTLFIVALFVWACGGGEKNEPSSGTSAKEKLAQRFGLTAFEYENGIGPIKEKIELGAIDMIKAKRGEKIFTEKCTQCHKLDERYTGPALRDVTSRKTPEFILNQILNPEEMTKRHPEVKKMLAQYATQMTFQNVSEDDAKAILEYLRSVNK
jgi:cytochrome c2